MVTRLIGGRFLSGGLVMVLLASACGGSIRSGIEARNETTPTTTIPAPVSGSLATAAITSTTSAPAVTAAAWQAQSTPCARPGGHAANCKVPEHLDRPMDIYVPSTYDPQKGIPLLVVLHGGGGNSAVGRQSTCLEGSSTAANCFDTVGEQEGFITVYANGSGSGITRALRTWNAGGGNAEFSCVSGQACENNVDDIDYLNTVLDEVERQYHIDTNRVYFTGFSNGAAMTHRVGCEMGGRVAAIVAVSGTNQFATSAPCDPPRPVPVLQIHGTEDSCWTYETSTQACADQDPRPKLGVEPSMEGWVERNRCTSTVALSTMPDVADDGTTTEVAAWVACAGGVEVVLMKVIGGGHVFPSGSLGSDRRVDRGTLDWGSEQIWAFLSRFSLNG